jgi:hypothetical protein
MQATQEAVAGSSRVPRGEYASLTSGRSPGLRVQTVGNRQRRSQPSPITFASSGMLRAAHRLQWRDRAGFTPDFPVTPFAGTQSVQERPARRRITCKRKGRSDKVSRREIYLMLAAAIRRLVDSRA